MVYLKKWFSCTNPTAAPRNDIDLLKEFNDYQKINLSVSRVAFSAFNNLLWYLNSHLIALSSFDDEVSDSTKTVMIANMNRKICSKTIHLQKISLKQAQVNALILEGLVSTKTKMFFEILFEDKDPSFLKMNPENWGNDATYLKYKEIVQNVSVVSDLAERGVALMKNFNDVITRDENQKQLLLQTVENHCKEYLQRQKLLMDTIITQYKHEHFISFFFKLLTAKYCFLIFCECFYNLELK